MKATELISRLAVLVREHGDRDLVMSIPNESFCTTEFTPRSIVTAEDLEEGVLFELYGEENVKRLKP